MKRTLIVLSNCQKQNLWMTKSEKRLKNAPKNPKTIAQTIWKNIAIVQYFCCLKNYLNTAFFEKKYCNRVFAIFYCAITMVWLRQSCIALGKSIDDILKRGGGGILRSITVKGKILKKYFDHRLLDRKSIKLGTFKLGRELMMCGVSTGNFI